MSMADHPVLSNLVNEVYPNGQILKNYAIPPPPINLDKVMPKNNN